MIRIDIEPVLDADGNQRHADIGPRYRTLVDGKVICQSTRLPVVATCRLLVAGGVTGAFETWRAGIPYPCMRGVVESAARVTIDENKKVGPRWAWYEARPS